MLDHFIRLLSFTIKQQKAKYVYFHNLSRFDGILLLKHLVRSCRHFRFKPIIKEHNVYQIAGGTGSLSKGGGFLLHERFYETAPREACFPGQYPMPQSWLNGKGSIPHDSITESYLKEKEHQALLIDYLRQDVLILAGVMHKAQKLYWENYKVDITKCLTLSALALKIYRVSFYPKAWPIYQPQSNQDQFIRQGYYGGHSDVYKPYGENLYYYDVNSLYPYAMTRPMPGGAAKWHYNLENADLDTLFGFVLAYVECPDTIDKPFLPYRNPRTNALLFPTGQFEGVYFTEELKFARTLGYKIVPKYGYLFYKKESPFKDFIASIYASRKQAKNANDEAISYIYKILMNSLYGRFGIRPQRTISEICDLERFDHLISNFKYSLAEPLTEKYS